MASVTAVSGDTDHGHGGTGQSRRRTFAIATAFALIAVLLPVALQVAESGAAGPPAGCNLFQAFEPTFVTNARLAFSSKEPSGSEDNSPRNIYVSDLNGTNRSEIGSVDVGTDPQNSRDPSAAPNGLKIAWDGITSGRAILVANADGTARVTASAGTDGTNRHPRWSADSSRITWYNEKAGIAGIYVANADGTAKTNISVVGANPDPTDNRRPVIGGPGAGTKVVWSGVDPVTLRREIYVANPDGTGRVAISSVGGELSDNNYPDINAAGTTVIWSGFDGSDYRIYGANLDGSGRSVVSGSGAEVGPVENTTPRFSPDGTKIVWVGDRVFNPGAANQFQLANVWVANANGSSRTDITDSSANDPSGNMDPVWSPDGTKIAWSGAATNGSQIWVANADGSGQAEVSTVDDTTLCDNTHPVVTFTTPADGVRYALNQSVTASYSCADAQSGIASCVGTLANGAPVNTSTRLTSATFTVTATNTAGLKTTVVHTYSVDAPAPAPTPTSTTTTSLPAGQPDCPNTPTPFTDVPSNSFAASDIRCIYGLGITTGTSNTTYSPASNVTREQMASFLARLWRAAGGGCPNEATPFTDVSAGSFAADDVRCIYGLGITTGTSNTTYSPKDSVTREQMAAFLARVWRDASGSCSTTAAPFTDVASNSFARLDINCIYALGITTGTSNTTYSPNDSVTREQMAAFLGRLYRDLDDLT